MSDPEGKSRPNAPRLRLLLVEDEALVAMHMENVLETLGHEVLAKAANVAQALSVLDGRSLDAAVLDVDLRGERVTPVADALAAAGVPFVLTTGYSDCDLREPQLQARPLLGKPVKAHELQEALERIALEREAG